MPSDRIAQLQRFFDEDPDDPFNLYALALEHQKDDRRKALEIFETLLEKHATYLPTYYHAAKLYQELNDREKAISVYERGIVLAKDLSDRKTMRELRSALDELTFE
jgi:tetratricopeptide (TPR) repeat protein